jgi:hypothetical protein
MRLLFSVLLLFSSGIDYAASQQPSSTAARKVDSYNDQIPSSEAEQWRLEDFMRVLSSEPDSKAYIIAYAGREDPPGKPRRYAARARNYLVEYRGIDPQRIDIVDGGRREEFIVELWIVPRNGKPPESTPAITVPDDLGDNLLYDDFGFGYDNFASRTENDSARLDGFAKALAREPGSLGCIIAYAMAGDDHSGIEWDAPGTALRTAREERAYVVKKHNLPLSRVSIIDGGYGARMIELWIMRPNARFDNGPFLYPSRLKANQNGMLTIGRADPNGSCCKACARGRAKNRQRRTRRKPAL